MKDLKVVSKSQQRRKAIQKDLRADTIIHLLIDASGSMANITSATLEGVNQYIRKQREEEGKVLVTVTMFDTYADWSSRPFVHTLRLARPFAIVDLADVPELTTDDYKADGGTPLRDALGYSIQHTDDTLARVKKAKKTDVFFVVVTDGQENQSQEFSNGDIKALIEEREAKGWTFVYMGADQDSWAETQTLGFRVGNVRNYAKADIQADAFGNLAAATTSYRSTSRDMKARGLVAEAYATSSVFADAGIKES